jgi:hypothetical protein
VRSILGSPFRGTLGLFRKTRGPDVPPAAYDALKGHRRVPSPEPQPAERINPGPERLHWRAKQTERATQHTHRWTLARRSATERATTNPYGITLNRAWTEWAAQHGVSETIAAALYLVSRNRKADKSWLSFCRARWSE